MAKQLTAGRELDALVGRKVMGFSEVVRGSVDYWVDRFGPLPHYSTDIAAAMQVVGRVRETRGYQVFSLHHIERESGRWVWRATFAYPNTNTAEADTPAEAICLAALAAIEGEG